MSISSENYTSASKIVPISKCPQRLLSTQASEATTWPLTDNLTAEMRAWFLGMEDNKLLALATLLDPRFKKLAFADRDAAEKGVRIIVSEAFTEPANSNCSNQPTSPSHSSSHSSTSQDHSEPNLLWQMFDEQVTQVATQRTGTSAYTELQQFIRSPVIPRGESVHSNGGRITLMYTQN